MCVRNSILIVSGKIGEMGRPLAAQRKNPRGASFHFLGLFEGPKVRWGG